MSVVIYLPDPVRLRAGIEVVRYRAQKLNVATAVLRHALHMLLREMQAGRSCAASVALASSYLRRSHLTVVGGSDAA